MSAVCDPIPNLGDLVYIGVFEFVPESKKIDYYRRLGIPMSYLRAGVQSLIINLLHFFSRTNYYKIIIYLTNIYNNKNLVWLVKSG